MTNQCKRWGPTPCSRIYSPTGGAGDVYSPIDGQGDGQRKGLMAMGPEGCLWAAL